MDVAEELLEDLAKVFNFMNQIHQSSFCMQSPEEVEQRTSATRLPLPPPNSDPLCEGLHSPVHSAAPCVGLVLDNW